MNRHKRAIACGILALTYFAYRGGYINVPNLPAAVKPSGGLVGYARQMTREERNAVHDLYVTIGRSILADPESEPCFADMAAVRKVHRAGMLMLWKGALGNETGKYPGLREEIERSLSGAVGTDDVRLTKERKQEVGKAFTSVGEAFK